MFNLDHAEALGTGLIAATALLSFYFLILRIRDISRDKSADRNRPATVSELDDLRAELRQAIADSREARTHTDDSQRQSHLALQTLVHKNSEQIAALIAQLKMVVNRLAELTSKTERMQEKL